MKTILSTLLALIAAAQIAGAQIQYIDYTTPHGGGVFGDSWPVFAAKINTNFGYLYGLITNGGLTNPPGAGGTNYYTITTNLYLTQNNYSYPSTNIYTGALTVNTNVYAGSNYFDFGTNIYITSTTNFIINIYTNGGGTATNAIEKDHGGGIDITITNTLTLVNTNYILGWNVQQIMTISTNAQGVYSTNIFTLVPTNSFLTDSNGYVIVPYSSNSNAPSPGFVIGPGGSGPIPTNTTVPSFDTTNGQITVQWRGEVITNGNNWLQVAGGTATSVHGAAWTTTGDDITIDCTGKWTFSCGLSFTGPWGLASFDGFSVDAPTTGDVNGIYSFTIYSDAYYGAPVSNGRMIGTVTLSGFPNTYVPPFGFTPVGQSSVPIIYSNLVDYVVLKPRYDTCGGLVGFDIIGWNPNGNWNGLQYFTNSYGYNPIKASPCNPITATNWFVYHQGVWFPENCITELQSDVWGAGLTRSTEMWPLWDIVDFGTPAVGINLNVPRNGQWSVILNNNAPTIFHFDFWWLDYYNHGIRAWAESPHANYAYLGWDPKVYDHQPTIADEPRIGSLSGSWVSWATNTTAYTTNYFRLLVLSSGHYNASNLPPVPPQLALMYQPQVMTVITNITMTNNFFVVSNIITQRTPIYATTVLTAGSDGSLVVNSVTKAITTYNGTINTNHLAASINDMLKTIGTLSTTVSNQQVQINAMFHQLNP